MSDDKHKRIVADGIGRVYIRGPKGGLTRVGYVATRFDTNHPHERGDILCTARQAALICRALGRGELHG